MVCIFSCIASLGMNLNKGQTVAFVSCALACALASYMIFKVWHVTFPPCVCGNTDNGEAFMLLCNSTNFSVFFTINTSGC
jgi:hypothetical protein